MRPKPGTAEEKTARIAGRQHGVVTRRQLLGAGVTADEIKMRLRKGALIAVFRGVYRVGHEAPSTEATYMAAVLACGPGALLCGRAAAWLLSLVKGRPPKPEVLTPTERHIPGICTRQSRRIEPGDSALVRGIPTTTVPRTIVDLAASLALDDLARACHEAGVLHGTTPRMVETVLRRRPNTPGAAKLLRVVHGDAPVTLSKLEHRFLELLAECGLPLPVTNRPASGRRVDCRWPQHRLTVELDSYRFHQSRHAWERDRRREREAHARGDEFRRYTYGDVVEDPRLMLRELRSLLSN